MLIWLCLLALSSGWALAQGSAVPIQFNQNTIGELSATNSAASYSLTASGGETAVVQVLAVSPGLIPRFRILNAAGIEILNVANPQGLASVSSSAAFADVGAYIIEVSGENGSLGQFVLSLQPGTPPPEPIPLPINQLVSGTVSSDTPLQVYRFSITPPISPPLTIQGEGETGVLISLFNEDADKTIATQDADVSGVVYRLPAAARAYRLEIRASSAEATAFTLCLGTCEGTPPPSNTTSGAVVVTPEVAAGSCTAVSNTNSAVNVRSGPGTQYAIVGSLPIGQSFPVLGQLAGGGWYQVSLNNGGSGWVSATVARLEGECAALAVVAAPANAPLAPTQPPAPTLPPVPTTSGGGGGTSPTTMPTTAPPAAPSPEPLPDISVTISYAVLSGDSNADIGYSIVVRDLINPFSYRVQICIDDTCIFEDMTALSSSSSGTSRTFPFTPDGRRITHRVTITVDSTGDVVESNESNNDATYNFQ
jgi:hypothetical protein